MRFVSEIALNRKLGIWPVSLNNAYANGAPGRGRYPTLKARQWKQKLRAEFTAAWLTVRPNERHLLLNSTPRLRLTLRWRLDRRYRGDVDNLTKLVQDTLCEVLGVNDRRLDSAKTLEEPGEPCRLVLWLEPVRQDVEVSA